jgi:hypothetical protein
MARPNLGAARSGVMQRRFVIIDLLAFLSVELIETRVEMVRAEEILA